MEKIEPPIVGIPTFWPVDCSKSAPYNSILSLPSILAWCQPLQHTPWQRFWTAEAAPSTKLLKQSGTIRDQNDLVNLRKDYKQENVQEFWCVWPLRSVPWFPCNLPRTMPETPKKDLWLRMNARRSHNFAANFIIFYFSVKTSTMGPNSGTCSAETCQFQTPLLANWPLHSSK